MISSWGKILYICEPVKLDMLSVQNTMIRQAEDKHSYFKRDKLERKGVMHHKQVQNLAGPIPIDFKPPELSSLAGYCIFWAHQDGSPTSLALSAAPALWN